MSLRYTPTTILYLLLLFQLFHSSVSSKPIDTPTDFILLSCGESSNTTSPDGRSWDGDASSKFLVDNPTSPSSASITSHLDPSVFRVPYFTARTFHSNISYIFPVSRGPKFVRLYFYPSTYSNLDVSQSFFSLTANHFTLLYNFSAFLVVSAKTPPVHTLVKEFVVPVLDNEKLELIFSPSPASFGFVNGIEIVSMPDTLYYPGVDKGLLYVGFYGDLYPLDNFTALETVYRLEVGGQYISRAEDTGLFREWLDDSDYIFGGQYGLASIPRENITINYTDQTPSYVAPAEVYRTMRSMGENPEITSNYNLTWDFPIDAGFTYLVRLHFCETRMEVMRQGVEIFSIFINNQTAEKTFDVIFSSGGNSIPVYRDYVVSISEDSSRLWLALHPTTDLKNNRDAILNGLEMFKLNNSDGILAGRNPEAVERAVPTTPQLHRSVGRLKFGGLSLILSIGGAVFGIVIICLFLSVFVYRRRKSMEDADYTGDVKSSWMNFSFRTRSTNTTASLLPSSLCRRFSIFEIQIATGNFDEQNIIGCGGFGNVYKGYIDDGVTPVAIKRLNSTSQQGSREFRMEIDLLSKLRHLHLVSLIGYCDDPGEMILVYEYMHRGTLRDHLYKTKNPSLPFKQRLEICIGAAKGLYYLHSGSKNMIIHRDVKSTNILLDENWVAKVSDFGLSRIGPTRLSQTHVSTVVRGSIGYVDPEYFRKQHLTQKSDVYSFGVVLLEVLCSRPPVILGLPKEQVSLADWARLCFRRGEIDRIIDPHLKGKIELRCLNKFGQIAESCVNVRSAERPTMGDVVWGLEFALQLQEFSENVNDIADIQVGCSVQERPLLQLPKISDEDEKEDDMYSGSSSTNWSKSKSTLSSSSDDHGRNLSQSYEFRSENVFSEIKDQRAR